MAVVSGSESCWYVGDCLKGLCVAMVSGSEAYWYSVCYYVTGLCVVVVSDGEACWYNVCDDPSLSPSLHHKPGITTC